MLICRLGVFRVELEAVLNVGYRWGSERVKLILVRVAKSQLIIVLVLGDVGRHRLRELLLYPLNLAHCKFPPLLGVDRHPLALAEGDRHLLSSQPGICHLGGHEGTLLGLLSDLDLS